MFDTNEKEISKRLLVNTEASSSIHVYQMQGTAVRPLEKIIERLVKHIQNIIRPKIHVLEMAVDFIRDEQGNYWFLQVKAIKLNDSLKLAPKPVTENEDDESATIILNSKKFDYMRLKECKMCLNLYPPQELTYSMSYKMIYATERHLKRRSVKLAWFDRPEFTYVKDTSTWYQTHKVCKNCFDMYIQEQKLSKVEFQFAKAIGIPVDQKTAQYASIINNMQEGFRVKNRHKSMMAKDKSKGPSSLIMYRLITYINELRNIPETLPDKFSLCYTIFGNETIVPLKTEQVNTESKVLDIGKLRVFYFFVSNDEIFRKWVHEEKVTNILL